MWANGKQKIFGYLKDRIWKLISGWTEKFLSKMGMKFSLKLVPKQSQFLLGLVLTSPKGCVIKLVQRWAISGGLNKNMLTKSIG
jgi:hypothetical protein